MPHGSFRMYKNCSQQPNLVNCRLELPPNWSMRVIQHKDWPRMNRLRAIHLAVRQSQYGILPGDTCLDPLLQTYLVPVWDAWREVSSDDFHDTLVPAVSDASTSVAGYLKSLTKASSYLSLPFLAWQAHSAYLIFPAFDISDSQFLQNRHLSPLVLPRKIPVSSWRCSMHEGNSSPIASYHVSILAVAFNKPWGFSSEAPEPL